MVYSINTIKTDDLSVKQFSETINEVEAERLYPDLSDSLVDQLRDSSKEVKMKNEGKIQPEGKWFDPKNYYKYLSGSLEATKDKIINSNVISNLIFRKKTELQIIDELDQIVLDARIEELTDNAKNSPILNKMIEIIRLIIPEQHGDSVANIANYKREIDVLVKRPKLQKLSIEKVEAFENVLRDHLLERLIKKKGDEVKDLFEKNGFIFPEIQEDFFAWIELVSQEFKIPLDENLKFTMFNKILESGFGPLIDLVQYMDVLVDLMEAIDMQNKEKVNCTFEDYLHRAEKLHLSQTILKKWQALAWVFSQISGKPMPFNPETPQLMMSVLFNSGGGEPAIEDNSALQMDPIAARATKYSSPLDQKMDELQNKMDFARKIAQSEMRKKNRKPVDYILDDKAGWYYRIPIKVKYEIFDNLRHGVYGRVEDTVRDYLYQNYEQQYNRQTLMSDVKWDFDRYLIDESEQVFAKIQKKKIELKEKASVILKYFIDKNRSLPELKNEICAFVDSARLNDLFDEVIFNQFIYDQAREDGVFDTKATLSNPENWGHQHASHKVDRFLAAFERYKVAYLDEYQSLTL